MLVAQSVTNDLIRSLRPVVAQLRARSANHADQLRVIADALVRRGWPEYDKLRRIAADLAGDNHD